MQDAGGTQEAAVTSHVLRSSQNPSDEEQTPLVNFCLSARGHAESLRSGVNVHPDRPDLILRWVVMRTYLLKTAATNRNPKRAAESRLKPSASSPLGVSSASDLSV